MILSMTGYGKVDGTTSDVPLSVEVKTLNSKFLDVHCKLPETLKSLELEIKKILTEKLVRGKVEFAIVLLDKKNENKNCVVDKELVKSYVAQMKDIYDIEEKELFKIAMKLPLSVSKTQKKQDLLPKINTFVLEKVNECLDKVISFRKDEGNFLAVDLRLRINNIKVLNEEIPKYENERISSVREKLGELLKNRDDLDNGRFEQEVLYYLEKMDITEEKVRLQNHLDYFLKTLENNDSIGKKLGFITQEIGREINTLGSKSYHSDLQKIVVEMKNELEKIKEQILNIL